MEIEKGQEEVAHPFNSETFKDTSPASASPLSRMQPWHPKSWGQASMKVRAGFEGNFWDATTGRANKKPFLFWAGRRRRGFVEDGQALLGTGPAGGPWLRGRPPTSPAGTVCARGPLPGPAVPMPGTRGQVRPRGTGGGARLPSASGLTCVAPSPRPQRRRRRAGRALQDGRAKACGRCLARPARALPPPHWPRLDLPGGGLTGPKPASGARAGRRAGPRARAPLAPRRWGDPSTRPSASARPGPAPAPRPAPPSRRQPRRLLPGSARSFKLQRKFAGGRKPRLPRPAGPPERMEVGPRPLGPRSLRAPRHGGRRAPRLARALGLYRRRRAPRGGAAERWRPSGLHPEGRPPARPAAAHQQGKAAAGPARGLPAGGRGLGGVEAPAGARRSPPAPAASARSPVGGGLRTRIGAARRGVPAALRRPEPCCRLAPRRVSMASVPGAPPRRGPAASPSLPASPAAACTCGAAQRPGGNAPRRCVPLFGPGFRTPGTCTLTARKRSPAAAAAIHPQIRICPSVFAHFRFPFPWRSGDLPERTETFQPPL